MLSVGCAEPPKKDKSQGAYERLPDSRRATMTLGNYRSWLCNNHGNGVWTPYLSVGHLIPMGNSSKISKIPWQAIIKREAEARAKALENGYCLCCKQLLSKPSEATL